jgi:dipeptidyl aminopeptidase/acylaminoacyl peptidase
MKLTAWSAFVSLVFWLCGDAVAKPGDLLSREPVTAKLNYSDWLERAYGDPPEDPRDQPTDLNRIKAYYTHALYDSLFARRDIAADRIIYDSDGLKVAGYAVYPLHPEGKLPVIIWCRGGETAVGEVRLGDLLIMSNWARRGFVVLATQYRGGPGSEGKDEFGGDDVHDVERLADVPSQIESADPERVYLYGYSRGGMMVYRAMADGMKIRAAVVNSGLADVDEPSRADMLPIYKDLMPDYAAEAANHFCRRSAICWPDKLEIPLLILHGAADWRVLLPQASAPYQALRIRGYPTVLHVYKNGAHVSLNGEQQAIDDEILNFLASYE